MADPDSSVYITQAENLNTFNLASPGKGLVCQIWHGKQFFEDKIITVGLIFMYKLCPKS